MVAWGRGPPGKNHTSGRTPRRCEHGALGHRCRTHDLAMPAWRPGNEASVRVMVRRSRTASGVVQSGYETARRGQRLSVAVTRAGTTGGCLCSVHRQIFPRSFPRGGL